MRLLYILSIILSFLVTNSYAENEKDFLSNLPQELVSEITKNLDPQSIINLKSTSKALKTQVETYLTYLNSKDELTIKGNIAELKKWLKILDFSLANQNSQVKKLVLKVSDSKFENLNWYWNNSEIFNDLLQKISIKFPNIEHLVIEKFIYNFQSRVEYSEFKAYPDKLYYIGTVSTIDWLIVNFSMFKTYNNIKTVQFDLLKNSSRVMSSIHSLDLASTISVQLLQLDTIIVNDIDNYYFEKSYFFSREEILLNIVNIKKSLGVSPINPIFVILRNGIEEKYYFSN
ncbi:hypothetical protein QEJ31_05645 [Pigmentibacter sp. JX0631]|uniref:F-box protein n=1 Tax=Pigmentibacter sp. JX0631 TaxID=2976982 RepID=UPI0024689713|nr:F-box protein [Pigmentibacter sp. JX0631]WGL61077.1 hypothetical protein QEJ31_05645 [Pigmentibacter sp. JX0631]